MKYDITIDYSIQLADVIKQAEQCYPLAKNTHQACYMFWHYQSIRMNNQKDYAVFYEANLKFKLLSLLMLTQEQFN